MARTTTKAPAPKAKLANPRNEALARMGKAELLKTVKTLDARVTKLLNRIAVLERGPVDTERAIAARPDKRLPLVSPVAHNGTLDELPGGKFPWEQ